MLTNMRKERMANDFTVKQVASKIGVHPNAVNRWETGKSDPSAANLIALSKFYKCSPEYLLGITDDRHGAAVAD